MPLSQLEKAKVKFRTALSPSVCRQFHNSKLLGAMRSRITDKSENGNAGEETYLTFQWPIISWRKGRTVLVHIGIWIQGVIARQFHPIFTKNLAEWKPIVLIVAPSW